MKQLLHATGTIAFVSLINAVLFMAAIYFFSEVPVNKSPIKDLCIGFIFSFIPALMFGMPIHAYCARKGRKSFLNYFSIIMIVSAAIPYFLILIPALLSGNFRITFLFGPLIIVGPLVTLFTASAYSFWSLEVSRQKKHIIVSLLIQIVVTFHLLMIWAAMQSD